jgi:hypothetical protein
VAFQAEPHAGAERQRGDEPDAHGRAFHVVSGGSTSLSGHS